MIKNKKVIKEIRNWILCILVAFLISAILRKEVLAQVQVQQNSMQNTLFSNEKLIVDKLSYKFSEPKRGDIIIFHEGDGNETIMDYAFGFLKDVKSEDSRLVKRVIGVAGDEVNIKDGYVYVNNEKIDEPYVKGNTINGAVKLPMKVEENQLFVLGDNREVSKDSRSFGAINFKQIEGKAVFRVSPFNKMGLLK